MKTKCPQPTLNNLATIGMIDFSKASEGSLLQFCLALYRMDGHDKEDPVYVFCQKIHKTPTFLSKCVRDIAHLGVVNWHEIQTLLPIKAFEIWSAFKAEQFELGLSQTKEREQ